MKTLAQHHGDGFAAFHIDAVEFAATLPPDSIDFSVYSPPFSSLYIYSESERDMGNVGSDAEFQEAYRHLVASLFRATKPGRLTAIHVKDLVYYSNASERGDRGLRDFTGSCTATHTEAGWTYHRKVTIPRDPMREMQKTKSDRLLYKNFRTDAARTGGGMPEYIVFFRKWTDDIDATAPVVHMPNDFPLEVWQEWAESVWPNTRETDVLNAKLARADQEERHLCPMPLDLIKRCVLQYTNPGETVFSPFMGIGSEGYVSLRHGRKFIGTELEPKYYRQAVRNLKEAEHLGPERTLLANVNFTKPSEPAPTIVSDDQEHKPEVEAFLAEIAAVSERHRLSLSHEDSEGGFLVETLAKENLDWLRRAADRRGGRRPKRTAVS